MAYGWTYDLGAWLLLATSAVAFEPLRRHVSDLVGARLLGRPRPTELVEALEKQEQRADHATRLAEIGSLTSAVAHEVRGPLGVISAQLRLLEKSGADEAIIDDIRAQVRRTERFVDDMLRYGRPRPLELRSTDLSALAELAVSTARSSLGDGAPNCRVDTEGLPEGLIVEVDHAQLLQVLVILVDNALLARAEREHCELRLRGRAAEAHIELELDDDGPGIPEEIFERVFEPFVTGRKRKSPRPGTGLGLAIARNIVERHGGTITAGRSELGGARFTLTLPRQAGIMGADAPEKIPA
jgi:signal transduction histidine kinase